jgi:hypothetical protein
MGSAGWKGLFTKVFCGGRKNDVQYLILLVKIMHTTNFRLKSLPKRIPDMRLLPPLAALLFGLPLTSGFAAETNEIPLSYEIFEAAVAYIDLESCPADFAQEGVFCRATLANEEVHVFAFSTEGESLLAGFASYDATDLPKLLN